MNTRWLWILLAVAGCLLALLGLPRPAWPSDSVALTLRPLSAEGSRPEISGSVTLLTEDRAPVRHPLSSWEPLPLEIPDRVPTRIRIEAAGFWAAEAIVLPTGEPVEKSVRLLPAGTLQGSVAPPHGEPLPPALSVTFEPAVPFRMQRPENDREQRFPRTTRSCPVDAEGRWSCTVPSGRLDVRLRVQGFISRYHWGVEVAAGEDSDLGKLALRPGASVVGWVRTADQSPLEPGVRARLLPTTAGSQLDARAAGVDRRAESAEVDGRGFFHFRGVAPGSYTLRVEQEGFAPAERPLLTVLEGRETNLREPLVLDRPVRFEVALIPPVDPYGRRWRLSLEPVSSGTGGNPEAVGADGLWQRDGLAPGSYRLTVESGRGRYEHTWWSEEVTVAAGQPIYELRLPVVEVVGTVLLGDEPLEAILRFGGRFGGRQLDLDTDEEGRFAGYLPEEGDWPVSVYSKETGWRNLREIAVELPPGERLVELEIRIPDLTISGEVVDGEGERVSGAQIWAYPLGDGGGRSRQPDRTTTDDDGKFRLRGLEAGSWLLSAQRGGGSAGASNGVVVELSESRAPEPVRLTLERWVEVEGRLLSSAGPVAGARVQVAPRLPGEYLIFAQPGQVTDADGRFRFTYPQRAAGVDLSILPPGFAATARFFPSPLSDSITVHVVQEGGTLILDLASFRPDLAQGALPTARLLVEGADLSLGSARTWARLQGVEAAEDGKLRIPMLAPGSYTLCVANSSGELDGNCATGWLPPHGELTLAAKE